MRITQDTVVLITGGASGLGAATATRFHEDGAAVIVLDLPGAAGETFAASLGERATFVPADVRDEDQVRAAVERAAGLGELRVAVTCAGVATPGRLLGRAGVLPLEDLRRVIDINLVGTANVLRLAAQAMAGLEPVDGERGVVVMTSSVAAFDGQVGQAAYAASKGGVAALTLPAARDLAQHLIRVVSIAPGTFATPLLAGLPSDAMAALEAQTPHPARLGRPEEYAALAAHVVENPMLNGETIRLDGALRMPPR
ncbi:SDR family NAD(P)-dependent oxidoreductase [Pseudactinotalea suaedae]|uniref:SDR family NAD(P)-dependent oxidoreductase n=1 Tax=Pseudactinotalea suaedae TaxID=1524924 RepID=UPI0012E0FF4F|nr:SDR family NAD(P)-dependent oxidoreductase [Pseudactinotalea suaedae]